MLNMKKEKKQPEKMRAQEAARIERELLEMVEKGKLPEGFDLTAALSDDKFARLLTELPAYAAVRVYMAEEETRKATEKAIAQLTQQRQIQQDLPKPSRGVGEITPAMDYMKLTSEEFAKIEERLRALKAMGLPAPR